MRRWLRFHLRKYFKPIEKGYARKQQQRLALVYLFLAWNSAGYLLYCCIKHKYPMTEKEKEKSSLWYLRLAGIDKFKAVRYEGFELTKRLEYENFGEKVTVLPLDRESENTNNLIVNE